MQGRLTALFLGILPYAILSITYCIAPGYICSFINHPIARIIALALIIWELIGAYILVKLTTLKPEQTAKEAAVIPLKMIPVIIIFIFPLVVLPMIGFCFSNNTLPPCLEPWELQQKHFR